MRTAFHVIHLALGLCFCPLLQAAAPVDPYNELFPQGTQITFIGDSITHGFTDPSVEKGDHYHGFFQAYFALRHPERDLWTKNSGRSGGTASSALSAQTDDKDIFKVIPGVNGFPDVAFIMMGMNDGGSLGYIGATPSESSKQARRNTYVNAMQGLINNLKSRNVEPAILSPTLYDEWTTSTAVSKAVGYNAELAIYTDLAKTLAANNSLLFVDVHTLMTQLTQARQATDPKFSYTRDRVHPNSGGHAIVLYQMLKALRLESDVYNVTIQAGTSPTVTNATNAAIGNLVSTGGELSWTAAEKSLPFPIKKTEYVFDRAFSDVPFVADFNQQLLSVQSLAAGNYILLINDAEVGIYSDVELAAGIDLSANTYTPQYQTAFAIREQLYSAQYKNIIKRDFNSTRLNMLTHYSNISFADPSAVNAINAVDWDAPTASDVTAIHNLLRREHDERTAAGLSNSGFFAHISSQTFNLLGQVISYNTEIAAARTMVENQPASRSFGYKLIPVDAGDDKMNLSYSTARDYSGRTGGGSASISTDGSALILTGDQWKRFDFPYTVTSNTVMEVTLSATDTGERVLVGLDDDNNSSTGSSLFQLAGATPTPGATMVTPGYTAGSGPVTFVIPIGATFTGSKTELVFVAGDAADSSASARFSTVKIYEANSRTLGVIAEEDWLQDYNDDRDWRQGSGWSAGEWIRGSSRSYVNAVKYTGSYAAQISGANASLTRSVNLSNYSHVEVSLAVQTSGLETGDSASAEFFDGVNWNVLETFTGNQSYRFKTYNLSRFTLSGTNQQFRLKTKFDDNGDTANIDTIKFKGLGPDAYEANDTVAAAFDFSANENTWLGTLSGKPRQKEDDWYEIVVSTGSTSLQVDCEFIDSHGNIDLELYQLLPEPSASQRRIQLVARAASPTDNETIAFAVQTPGIYYIRAYGLNREDFRERGNLENDYNLRWNDGISDPTGDAVFTGDTGWAFAPGGADLPPTLSALQGNADGDAFPDWAEFALGLDKTRTDQNITPCYVGRLGQEDYYFIEYKRSKTARLLGYRFAVQESEALNFDGSEAVPYEIISLDSDREKVICRSARPLGQTDRCFFRVTVSPPEVDY